jgi:hypothetical protein
MEVSVFFFFFFFLSQFSYVTLYNLKIDLALIGDNFYKTLQTIEQQWKIALK